MIEMIRAVMHTDSSSTQDKSLWQMQFDGQDVAAAAADDGDNDEHEVDEDGKGSVLFAGMFVSMRRGTLECDTKDNDLIARRNTSLAAGLKTVSNARSSTAIPAVSCRLMIGASVAVFKSRESASNEVHHRVPRISSDASKNDDAATHLLRAEVACTVSCVRGAIETMESIANIEYNAHAVLSTCTCSQCPFVKHFSSAMAR